MTRTSRAPVLAPGSADTCPICRFTPEQKNNWLTCPNDGHALKLRLPAPTDHGWTYSCLVCRYTHTQQEEATMTTVSEATTAALAIRDGQDFWDSKQLAALRQIGADDAPEGDLQVFFHYCQATGLDPFAKQIRLRKDRQKNANGQWEARWSIETEIDGYRVIAHRAAKRDGVTLSYGPMVWYDRAAGKHEIWLGDEPPAGSSLTVYKDGAPFPATVRFKSFAATNRDGNLIAQWAVMPDHMIAKCAEAQALRRAFPHDLEGIRISEEAPATAPAVVPASQIPQPRPMNQGPAMRSRSNRQALQNAIRSEFDRLGLDDHEERGVWVNRLNNKPSDAPLGELTDQELRVAHDVLSEKDGDTYVIGDVAALVELCDPGTDADPVGDAIEVPY